MGVFASGAGFTKEDIPSLIEESWAVRRTPDDEIVFYIDYGWIHNFATKDLFKAVLDEVTSSNKFRTLDGWYGKLVNPSRERNLDACGEYAGKDYTWIHIDLVKASEVNGRKVIPGYRRDIGGNLYCRLR